MSIFSAICKRQLEVRDSAASRLCLFCNASRQRSPLRASRCGALAVVFSYPPTHRTIQLKSEHAVVRPPAPGETDHVTAYVEAFTTGVMPFGYEPRQMATLFAYSEGDLVAIDFVPESAFVQTPGPKAGAPMAPPAR